MKNEPRTTLVTIPSSALDVVRPKSSSVIARMTQDVLVQARETALRQARFRIGDYELREPDYRQILRWATDGKMSSETVLSHLFRYSDVKIVFSLEDGAIRSMVWNFEKLPFVPVWERGLLIESLAFLGDWPDSEITLRPCLPKLKTLSCEKIHLNELDLTQVPGLTELRCWKNQLTELDLTPVPGLTELSCGFNPLTELDLTPVPGLTKLDCRENQLTELDLTPVPGLTQLRCWKNQLTELDLSLLQKQKLGRGEIKIFRDENVKICVRDVKPPTSFDFNEDELPF